MDLGTDSQSTLRVSNIVVALGIIGVLLLVFEHYFTVQKDAYEPPYLHPKIPVIGHLIGLIRQGADYYSHLEGRYHRSIYTLPILKGRMYMVTSPEWAQAVHRSHKTLYFNTLIAQAMRNLFLMDGPTMEIINDNMNGENGTRDNILLEIHDMMYATLSPGSDLDDLNKAILNNMAPDVNQLVKGGSTSRVELWGWIRHHFSLASVSAIWGPQNPFTLDPEAEELFWEFEANAMPLTMFPLPHIVARKAWNARKKLFASFEEYVERECYNHPETSQLIKNRVKINMGKYGLSKRMYAWGDASLLFGALLNTIPTAFWLMSWIFEDQELLSKIRDEVDKCITTSPTDPKKRTINATKLRTCCPLFSSVFRETLRMTGSVNSTRYVAQDTKVTNSSTGESYVLKKDSVVQIASNVIHFRSLWGSDAQSFNPRRFLSTGDKAKSKAGTGKLQDPAAPYRDKDGKIYGSAFRSFGGGNNICPGRHFAQTEIMALTSLFVAGFEVEGVDGSGYKMPPCEDFKLMLGVIKPGRDVEVDINRRKGYEDVVWEFEM